MIPLDPKVAEALSRPDSEAVLVEMTPALKEKYIRVCDMVGDLLRAQCEGPLEAYMILHFVQHGFEERYGIRGGLTISKDTPPQG